MIISLSQLAGVLGVTHDLMLSGSAFGSLSNEQARAFVGKDDVALTEHVRALGANGDDERSVAMFLSRRELKKVLPFLALGLVRLGDGQVTARLATAKSVLWAGSSSVDGPLTIVQGQTVIVGGDLEVNGWLRVDGTLVVAGSLRCVGLEIDTGYEENRPARSLACGGPVTTNALMVGVSSELALVSVHALVVLSFEGAVRGVSGVESALWYLERGEHWSDDEEEGAPPFGAAFIEIVEGLGDDDEVEDRIQVPDFERIRVALEKGEKVFDEAAPLVTKRLAARVEAAPLPPEVAELAGWLGAHPGPQRQLLSDFEASWLPRVLALSVEGRGAAAKLISKALKSPKLEADRARVVALLV